MCIRDRSWYDSAKQIVRENDDLDKTSQGLDGRLEQLFDKDTENMLDTVYVDVFFGTRWPMYKLVDKMCIRDRSNAAGRCRMWENTSCGFWNVWMCVKS